MTKSCLSYICCFEWFSGIHVSPDFNSKLTFHYDVWIQTITLNLTLLVQIFEERTAFLEQSLKICIQVSKVM